MVGSVFVLNLSLELHVCTLFLMMQLLPDKHSRQNHQGVRRQRDPDLWPGRRARAHAETTGSGQPVDQPPSAFHLTSEAVRFLKQ